MTTAQRQCHEEHTATEVESRRRLWDEICRRKASAGRMLCRQLAVEFGGPVEGPLTWEDALKECWRETFVGCQPNSDFQKEMRIATHQGNDGKVRGLGGYPIDSLAVARRRERSNLLGLNKEARL